MSVKRIISFPITPQTWVGYNQSSAKMLFIPLECQSRHKVTGLEEDKYKPCDHYSEENPYCFHVNDEGKKVFHTLSKSGRYVRNRIERYRAYKEALVEIADEKKFEFLRVGMGLMFYLPCPKRWSKTKKRHSHLTWHDYTPDLSNLLKAFEDALMPQDKFVGMYSHLGKKWVNFPDGWIEVTMPTKDEIYG